MAKCVFRRYKHSKLSLSFPKSIILMTSLCTLDCHQIFCPIKCSRSRRSA